MKLRIARCNGLVHYALEASQFADVPFPGYTVCQGKDNWAASWELLPGAAVTCLQCLSVNYARLVHEAPP